MNRRAFIASLAVLPVAACAGPAIAKTPAPRGVAGFASGGYVGKMPAMVGEFGGEMVLPLKRAFDISANISLGVGDDGKIAAVIESSNIGEIEDEIDAMSPGEEIEVRMMGETIGTVAA